MPSFGSETGNVLYLIVCGAPLAADTAELVKQKKADGWDVCVIATPHGLQWFDVEKVEQVAGHKVRCDFRHPGDPDFSPRGDVVLVAPATFNTLNKWALGISDTLALGLLNEAVGRSVPVTALLQINEALRAHPAFQSSVAGLSHFPNVTLE